jgi:hypothetical protein
MIPVPIYAITVFVLLTCLALMRWAWLDYKKNVIDYVNNEQQAEEEAEKRAMEAADNVFTAGERIERACCN